MNRYQSALETPLVGIARFDHPQDQAHRDPPEEEAHELSVNFVLVSCREWFRLLQHRMGER